MSLKHLCISHTPINTPPEMSHKEQHFSTVSTYLIYRFSSIFCLYPSLFLSILIPYLRGFLFALSWVYCLFFGLCWIGSVCWCVTGCLKLFRMTFISASILPSFVVFIFMYNLVYFYFFLIYVWLFFFSSFIFCLVYTWEVCDKQLCVGWEARNTVLCAWQEGQLPIAAVFVGDRHRNMSECVLDVSVSA